MLYSAVLNLPENWFYKITWFCLLSFTSKVDADDVAEDKLQALIEESRKMVNSLENYSPLSSPHSTPERKVCVCLFPIPLSYQL